ncbi:MAG: asparagine synthase (glutamine-hydrolyzing) [Clostridia bacterium]
MCGFIGMFNRQNLLTDENICDAEKMSFDIKHRGPDSDGFFRSQKACFAFRRLSIIDLENGSQPYISTDGRYSAVYNGEIYNYKELRDELVKKGLSFKTNSEIEVLIELYRFFGTGFIVRLRGMFAFLIYDTQTHTLVAARDPFGIKPLYYRRTSDGFVFASEMKAFRSDSGYDGFKVDKTLLQHYFTFQYVTEPDTICGDIFILPKGSYMTVTSKNEDITVYFKPIFSPQKSVKYDEKKRRLREAIEKSVEYHMISDVPVGAFLSSGIDSAVITAIASKLQPGIKAFTVGFNVNGYSELEDANNFEKTIYHLDSPLADPSVVAIYLIAKKASEHVKVVLTGEGSDELFGGYRQYSTVLSTSKIQSLPKFIKSMLYSLAKILPDNVKGKNFLLSGLTPIEERFVGNSFLFKEEEKKFLNTYDSAVRFTDRTKTIYEEARGYSPLLKMQHCDLSTWLPSDILVKGDRLSMAHSLEARVPYLDKEVFKAAAMLCDNDKLKKDTTKYILRDAFSDLLNKETVMRPKLGYPVPVRIWLKDELYDWAKNIIINYADEDYINTNEALKLLEAHRTGKADLYHQIWSILTFLTWNKIYIK